MPILILFDLDGTLVDTATEIAAAVNRTLQEERLPVCSQPSITNWIGKGTAWLFGNALQEVTGDAAIRACDTCEQRGGLLTQDGIVRVLSGGVIGEYGYGNRKRICAWKNRNREGA